MCGKPSPDGFTHIKCKTVLGLDGKVSFFNHQGVIRKAIIALKYKYATDTGKDIIASILGYIKLKEIYFPKFDYLVPVPLYSQRENQRGFNQSEIIGRQVATYFNCVFFVDILLKKHQSLAQVDLAGSQRMKNVLGSFLFNDKYKAQKGRYVIFDDVYTTGSTLQECCKVLKRRGAKEVWGLTISC